jgi:hypothetical protein
MAYRYVVMAFVEDRMTDVTKARAERSPTHQELHPRKSYCSLIPKFQGQSASRSDMVRRIASNAGTTQ